jgi:dihydroorotate dehydrogenase electron transfer subunit
VTATTGTASRDHAGTGPLQVTGEVLATRRVGAYHHLTVVAEGVAERFRPGQFVAVAVGGPGSGTLLRRAFSIYRGRSAGAYGPTVEVIVAVVGVGTRWLADRQPHDPLDIVGPLGRPFALPQEPVACALVGGGYGSAPLFSLADALQDRGCGVHMVLGAATGSRLFGTLDARHSARSVTVTTDDGSVGIRGVVSDPLPGLLARHAVEVVYACGPMAMLRAVTVIGREHGVWTQTLVEESMACGIGVCMTCVLPVVGAGGTTTMVRSCVEGPVFAGDKVRWDDVGTVPSDPLGAPTPDAAPAGGRR